VGDLVMRTGDLVRITIDPPAIIPALEAPAPLAGSGGPARIGGGSVCLQGDELPDALRGPMAYTAPPFTTPGTGTLTVILTPSNMTVTARREGKALLIKGGSFVATFTVQEPAMQPTPAGPVPDPVLVKPGTAQFMTTNETVRAS
jgi:hypothetical protein